MARPTNEESKLKLIALKEAFEEIKPGLDATNIEEKTVSKANSSSHVSQFKTPISISSLKQPKTPGLKQLKKEIDEFREKCKDIKKNTPIRTKEIIDSLNEKIDSLSMRVVKLVEENFYTKERLQSKEEYIETLEGRLNRLTDQLSNLKKGKK